MAARPRPRRRWPGSVASDSRYPRIVPSGAGSRKLVRQAAGLSPCHATATRSRRKRGSPAQSSKRWSPVSYSPQCSANAVTISSKTAGSSRSSGVRKT